MAIPDPPTFYYSRRAPDLSDVFFKDVHELYRRNAETVAPLIDSICIERKITVTNSLVFAGSLRMQGTTRNILNEECSVISFHDVMNCTAASSSEFVLAKISSQLSWDEFLSLAGKHDSVLSSLLLEKICRALVLGTGDVCEKCEKLNNLPTIVEADVNTVLVRTPQASACASDTTPNAVADGNEPQGPISEEDTVQNNVESSNTAISRQQVSDSNATGSVITASRSRNLTDSRQKRALYLFDENTPPRKTLSNKTQHRRFASMPLQRLPSNSTLIDDDVFCSVSPINSPRARNNFNARSSVNSGKASLNGAAFSPLPKVDFDELRKASGFHLSSEHGTSSAGSVKSSRSLILISRNAHTEDSANGSKLHNPAIFDGLESRKSRSSTPKRLDCPSSPCIKGVSRSRSASFKFLQNL
ncbi:hypothetical protein GYMLUDRAFT_240366 [Collybiopsis luxurians FD-317 M1]|nr:hypothetical protein GYMLUDRAFT_240366 [Collybiopsis luxurians FD-317 M1]